MQSSAPLAQEYFDAVASYWESIYSQKDVYSVIHQERRTITMSLFDKAAIPPGSRVLEIGCGAGLTSVEIANRGYSVVAIDLAREMLHLTKKNAHGAGLAELIHTGQCNACALPFPDAFFPAVMAMGVLPWLPSIRPPLTEMARVLRPGGFLITSMDNRWRLINGANPNYWLSWGMARVRRVAQLGQSKPRGPNTFACSVAAFDEALRFAGLQKVWGATLGFGPFWPLNRIMANSVGTRVHHALQSLADKHVPVLQSMGAQYITLSKKI